MPERFWEIDFVRGLALIAMAAYHFAFDLSYFTPAQTDIYSFPWFQLGWFARLAFVFLAGMSLSISFGRAKKKLGRKEIQKKFFLRGAKIFALGMLITAFTFIFFRSETIWFGILHLIGISVILSVPFLGKKMAGLFSGIAVIAAGIFLSGYSSGFPWLLWIGLKPAGFTTFDYFPLLPWFGLVLIGMFAGETLYGGAKRRIALPEAAGAAGIREMCFLGRNSLPVYFLHQPAIIGIILVARVFLSA
ncbi:MAG: DUF1624 domain-containing protein [Candidatus Diapherotrites archaeon]|nr:DUF1624 domain-containing protein [Candidatus Diapherotrites archaeon]